MEVDTEKIPEPSAQNENVAPAIDPSAAPVTPEVKDEGVDIAPGGEAAQIAQQDITGEDEEGIELGDRVELLGGRFNKTRGRIYYLDDDIIRILPDGLSDRLVDVEIIDGEIDPSLNLETILILKKRVTPAFVSLLDIRAGQSAETFTASGSPVASYSVKEVNEKDDKATFVDESGDEMVVDFAFQGIPRDLDFAVIRTQDTPKPVEEEPVEEAAPVEEEEFEFLDELEVPEFEEITEIPSYQRTFPDVTQKNDMLQDLIKGLDPVQQKNLKRIRVLRRLVENMAQLRNDITQYNNTGQAVGILPTAFSTLADLLERTEFPLAKQVLSVARALYVDHSAEDIMAKRAGAAGSDLTSSTDPAITLHYLEDAVKQGIQYFETQMADVTASEIGGMVTEVKIPRWHTVWQGFFNDYFQVITANTTENLRGTSADKDIFRAQIPTPEDEEPTLTGFPNLDATEKDLIDASSIGKVHLSYLRSIGSRMARYGERKRLHIVEEADEAELYAYILFPLLYIRDLGVTRSGVLALDIANGAKEPKTMEMILEDGGGVSEIPSAQGIIAVNPTGASLGNIEISDWLKGQQIYAGGIADLLPYLRSFGLLNAELTEDQKEVLDKKVAVYQASVKKHVADMRAEVTSKMGEQTNVTNINLLTEEAAESLFKAIDTEPILLNVVSDFVKRYPAYSKNDIARFAAVYVQYADLLTSVLGANAQGTAIERNRAVRDQFLKALRDAIALQHKNETAGEAPTPNRCPHVESLSTIRNVRNDDDRIKLMIKLLNEFRGEKREHWIWCSVCKQHLMCEHEFLGIQEFLHPREKDVIHKQVLLTFSGGEFNGNYMCKNCGQGISALDFDTNLEYDDEGRPMMGRSVLVDEDALMDEELAKALTVEREDDVKLDFKSEDRNLIYRTINEIANLLGVYPDRTAYMGMINRVQAALATKPDRKNYVELQKRQAQRTGGKGTAIDFDVFINRIMVSLCGAALLIEVQTHVPDYVIRYTLQGCARPEFSGYPRDTDTAAKDEKVGIEYISCAIASITRRENPWDLTGFQAVRSDQERIKRIAAFVEGAAKELANTADVQQAIATKKQYLSETYGAEAALGRPKDSIPEGFTPEQIILTKAQAETAEAPIIEAAASPKQRVRAWILEAHRLARLYGKYLPGSPFSEASCCYSGLSTPGKFWMEQAGLPKLPGKQPPRGPRGSFLFVHMVPRRIEDLFGKADATIFYRLFMRVCFRGARVGLQHEPGYTGKCPWCGLQFPEDPRLPPPQPRFAKDGGTQKKYDEEYTTAINQKEQSENGALEKQGVEVTKESFEELLKETNRRFLVPKLDPPDVPIGKENLSLLLILNPAPFENYLTIMNQTIQQVSALPADADKSQMAIAYGPISEVMDMYEGDLERRLGAEKYKPLSALFRLPPQSLGETLRSYFLIPFQRALSGIDLKSSLKVPTTYELGYETKEDIERFLMLHVDIIPKMKNALDTSEFGKSKARELVARLSVVIPLFVKVLRANVLPAGSLGMEYIQRAIIAGILSEFVNPNHVPDIDETNVVAPSRPITTAATLPIQMLAACLQKYNAEGLTLSPEEIRVRIADRNEKEKSKIIKDFDVMDKESKKLELLNKSLGLGKWAVGGTKVIWQYDEDQYNREKIERAAAGISDFPMGSAEYEDFRMDEGGYDVVQTREDDA